MFQIKFIVGNYAAREREIEFKNEDPTIIQISLFEYPISIVVNDCHIFELIGTLPSQESHLYLPIIDMVCEGIECVRELKGGGKYNFTLHGYGDTGIMFERENDIVFIRTRWTHREFSLPNEEVIDGFFTFEKSVKEHLVRNYPRLLENEYWGRWLENKILSQN
jgi:hypothetical protein